MPPIVTPAGSRTGRCGFFGRGFGVVLVLVGVVVVVVAAVVVVVDVVVLVTVVSVVGGGGSCAPAGTLTPSSVPAARQATATPSIAPLRTRLILAPQDPGIGRNDPVHAGAGGSSVAYVSVAEVQVRLRMTTAQSSRSSPPA
jgi:hypothetical protein